MKFGPVPVAEAEGTILAHSLATGKLRMRKARLLTKEDIAQLVEEGVKELVVARLEPGDVEENLAATRIAEALQFSGIEARPAATGRVNLHAPEAGVFTVNKELIDAINGIDPSVTIATRAQHATIVPDQMVATVKIIPFAVRQEVLDRVIEIARSGEAFAAHPFRPLRVGVVQTVLPTVKDSVLDKTVRITEARLARSGSHVGAERRTPHRAEDVADAIDAIFDESDMVLVFGASAMADGEDVLPAAIRRAGGDVLHVGMPVDPGNLFILGEREGKPVLGAPGCARSPKENGFDWVLDRIAAGVPVHSEDISAMGVGGLLMEIPSRPEPREKPVAKAARPKIYAVLLAAGQSSRMGGPNKLLAGFDGKPLVRRTAERVLASGVDGLIVVTGHQATRIREALADLDVSFAHNPDFADGLSGSLKAGIQGLAGDAAGAMIVLGDMPGVTEADYRSLLKAFGNAGGKAIARAAHQGKRGNPVVLPRSLFPAVEWLQGDVGARHLVESGDAPIVDVEIGEGAELDVDTPDAMERAGGVLAG
ncbi:MAG: NTP transferase domain-containing protein [Rhizobiaceae bacterium]